MCLFKCLTPSLSPPPATGSDSWTAAERRQFNKGITAYKKDFFMVQKQVRVCFQARAAWTFASSGGEAGDHLLAAESEKTNDNIFSSLSVGGGKGNTVAVEHCFLRDWLIAATWAIIAFPQQRKTIFIFSLEAPQRSRQRQSYISFRVLTVFIEQTPKLKAFGFTLMNMVFVLMKYNQPFSKQLVVTDWQTLAPVIDKVVMVMFEMWRYGQNNWLKISKISS